MRNAKCKMRNKERILNLAFSIYNLALKKREAALSQGCLAISKSLIKNIACFVKASIL